MTRTADDQPSMLVAQVIDRSRYSVDGGHLCAGHGAGSLHSEGIEGGGGPISRARRTDRRGAKTGAPLITALLPSKISPIRRLIQPGFFLKTILLACGIWSPGVAWAAPGLLPGDWSIGPVIGGRDYSAGMPGRPRASADGKWEFAFPRCSSPWRARGPSVRYVTVGPRGVMAGRVVLAYEIRASTDAVFMGADNTRVNTIKLYLQRRGDDWSASGKYAVYRWWSHAVAAQLKPGAGMLSEDLAFGRWNPVVITRRNTPAWFQAAVVNAGRVGFTFGNSTGAGHGVCLKAGTARFILKDFRVE